MRKATLLKAGTLFGLCALLSVTPVKAQETMEEPATEAGMDEAMMAKMQEYSLPGEGHQILNYFVGDWEYTMKWWTSPESEPEESTGTGSIISVMDGRFIEQIFEGAFMGQPFTGRGTLGFDNLKKEYVFTWIDNMSTGIMSSTGTYDEVSKTLTETGSHSCPISESGVRSFRGLTKIVDDNAYTYEVFTDDPMGNEFKSMEIMYKRKP